MEAQGKYIAVVVVVAAVVDNLVGSVDTEEGVAEG